MARKHLDWKKDVPLQDQCRAKHNVLRGYLEQYFRKLVSHRAQEKLRLTIVDGFCGGGAYIDNGHIVDGSPLICLRAARAAEFLINQDRTKKVSFEIAYFFIDKDVHAIRALEDRLKKEGFGQEIGHSIHLIRGKFVAVLPSVLQHIRQHNPQNGRSLFVLDQYGYTTVPNQSIHDIAKLPKAEIILTFAVDSMANFLTESRLKRHLPRSPLSYKEILESEHGRRFAIQKIFHQDLRQRFGFPFYTPFFISNKRGHGDYWLIHLSKHFRARDVMTTVHWEHDTQFNHYGGAGLNMLGYDPDFDFLSTGQYGFGFDSHAKVASTNALAQQLPQHLINHRDGMSFENLMISLCNGSPATEKIHKEALSILLQEKELQLVSSDGKIKRSSKNIQPQDIIRPHPQLKMFSK